MKLRSLRVLVAAAAALAVSVLVPVPASAEAAAAAVPRDVATSTTELLEELWAATFGVDVPAGEQEEVLVITMVDDATALTDDEKALACRVAVQRIEEQALLAREAQRVAAHLRTPLGHAVTVHVDGGTQCDALPTAALVRECARIAAMDAEIVPLLEADKSPDAICDALQANDPPPLSCKLCKRFVKMVDDAVQQDMAQVQQVREILGDICDSMSVDSMCHTFIKHYDDIVQWLVHGTDPEIVCERLAMCVPVDDEAVAVVSPDRVPTSICDDTHGCFYCEHITGAVAFVLQHAPGQLDMLHKAIQLVCKLAPKDCKCDDLSTNFDKIGDWTKQGKSPEEICITIGMCKKADLLVGSTTKHLSLATNPTLTGMTASLLLMEQKRGDKKCFYCEYFTTLLQVAVQEDEADIDQIRQYADLICGILGDNKYCLEYVSKLDTALDDIKKGEKPHEICTELQFCPKKVVAVAELPVSTTGDDKQCLYCDYFVTLLEVVLQEDDADVEQVRQYADLVCGMLGDDSVCHQYVDKFDAALDALKQGKKPRQICADMKFCTKTQALALPLPTFVKGDQNCLYCDYVVIILKVIIEQDKADIDQVRDFADMICGMLGDDNVCHQYVGKLDIIIDDLKAGKKPHEICIDLKHCTKKVKAVEHVPSVTDDKKCIYCDYFVTIMEVIVVQDDSNINMVREFADMVCGLLGDDNVCHQYVKNFDSIVDELKQGKKPHDICADIGFCTKTQPRLALPAPVAGNDDKTCFYCDYVVTILEVALQEDPNDVDAVRMYADIVCGMLGDGNVCHQYVDKLKYAIDALQKGKKPREICTELKFCTKQVVVVAQLPVSTTGDDKQCLYCDYFVTLLEVVLQEDDADVEQIRQYADLVCGMLGDDSICHQYVNQFDAALDALKQGKKPRQICADMKFCTKTQALALPLPTFVKGDQNCLYCDYVVIILKVIIEQDKADIDQVREFADMICGILGDDNVCHQYVGKLDIVIDDLRAGKKPHEICIDLKLCTKKATAVEVAPSVTDDKKCIYCDYFVTIMEVMIVQDDSNINMVREFADVVCGLLGDDNVCHQYVKNFDSIVDELKQGKKPHDICADIGFCTKTQPRLALPAPVAGNDDKTCFYCDYVVTILEVALQEDPNDVDAVRMYADIVCGMLGDGNVCHQYVDKLKYAIDALQKGKKPREICTELKLCKSKAGGVNSPVVLDTPSLLKDVMTKSVVSSTVGGIDECFFCTQVSSLLKVAIAQDPSKVSEIRTVADLVCKTLPAANKCHAVMHEIDQIIDSLKKGEEPAAICRDMKFCTKAVATIPIPKVAAGVKDSTCAYCDGIATVLEYALKSKPDQVQQLREAAGLVCSIMPQDDKCHDDLKMFDKAVVELKSGKSPHSICVEFNLCKSTIATPADSKFMPSSIAKLNALDSQSPTDKSVESDKSMSMGCLLCEYTAEGLVFIKGDTSKLHLAKQALETMCFVLPPNARCDVLSSKFDNLVELVRNGKSPSQACHAVSLCDAAFVEPPTSTTEPKRIGAVVADE